MNQMHLLAKLLICSWAVGGEQPQDLPTAQGILDRALELAREQQALPSGFWDQVHFAESRIGLQCIELPDILDWAQTAELTEVPNPSYRKTRIKITPGVARRMLADLGIPVAEAVNWGKSLRAAADQASAEFTATG